MNMPGIKSTRVWLIAGLVCACLLATAIVPTTQGRTQGQQPEQWEEYLRVRFANVRPPDWKFPNACWWEGPHWLCATRPAPFWEVALQNNTLAGGKCDEICAAHPVEGACLTGFPTAYVQDSQLWLRQINGCRWKDPATGVFQEGQPDLPLSQKRVGDTRQLRFQDVLRGLLRRLGTSRRGNRPQKPRREDPGDVGR